MSRELLHYAITGGPIRAAFDQYVADTKEARRQLVELTKEVGAEPGSAYVRHCVVAFRLDTKPKGWKKAASCDGYEPGIRMTELRERMRSIVIPNGETFLIAISGRDTGHVLIGHVMYNATSGYKVIRPGLDILTLNQMPLNLNSSVEDWGAWWKPEEDEFCRRLKLSEYHQIIEEYDERKAAAAKPASHDENQTSDSHAL